ncbi:MAG: hypothetical protein RL376_844 [Verrucomicrobiota bacterium]
MPPARHPHTRPRWTRFLAVLLVGLLLSGSSWDTLQLLATTRQAFVASQFLPLLSALRVAFAPGNLCSIEENSRDQRRARATSDPAEAVTSPRKLTLATLATEPGAQPPLAAPPASFARPAHQLPPIGFISEVPVPPPRFAA